MKCPVTVRQTGHTSGRVRTALPDARNIADDLTRRNVRLNLGGSVYDPTDPVGRLLFNVLAMVAEFEADLIRARTREGMKVAKANGRLRGKQPKLTPLQEAHLVELHRGEQHTSADLAELFGVARSTVHRALQRASIDARAAEAAQLRRFEDGTAVPPGLIFAICGGRPFPACPATRLSGWRRPGERRGLVGRVRRRRARAGRR